MRPDFAEEIVEQFERGGLSRRQLASRLMGLGAALAVLPGTARGDEDQGGHLPCDRPGSRRPGCPGRLRRSRDFYIKHLGLEVIRDGGEDNGFLGSGGGLLPDAVPWGGALSHGATS